LPPGASDPRASAIYQEVLDILSTAILAGDAPAYMARVPRPHPVETRAGTMVVETDAQMAALVHALHEGFAAVGATHYIRLATGARFTGPDEIEGAHRTNLLRNGTRLVPAYDNRMTLRRASDGLWRVVSAWHDIENCRLPFSLPSLTPVPRALEENR
jgi:hypothetical protein